MIALNLCGILVGIKINTLKGSSYYSYWKYGFTGFNNSLWNILLVYAVIYWAKGSLRLLEAEK